MRTYQFEDGTEIDVKIISKDPDKAFRNSIYVGVFGPEVTKVLAYSHYAPNKYFLSTRGGLYGGTVDATFFIKNKIKRTQIKQSVRQVYMGNDRVKRYVLEISLKKRRSYGPHAGFGFNQYDDFSAYHFIGGFSMVTAKQAHWLIPSVKGSNRRGASVSRLNADVVFYFNRELNTATASSDTDIDNYSRPLGLRLYYDGWSSGWGSSGKLTFHYMAGFALYSDLDAIPVIFGLGIGYSFVSY
jgi:hypothetical protein